MSKLAEHLGVTVSSMSTMVAALERKGHIARARNPRDGRSVGLTLTKIGTRLKENNSILDPDLMKQLFRVMPQREIEHALSGIECLAKYAGILLARRKRERNQ